MFFAAIKNSNKYVNKIIQRVKNYSQLTIVTSNSYSLEKWSIIAFSLLIMHKSFIDVYILYLFLLYFNSSLFYLFYIFTLRVFYTPHFPHSAFLHSIFSTLLVFFIFHTPRFSHSPYSPHTPYFPPNPKIWVMINTSVIKIGTHLFE